jgi:hypothetical protein
MKAVQLANNVIAQPNFLRLARQADLDEETAYTICRLISGVGWEVKGNDWDWDWLENGNGNYGSLINGSLVVPAWQLLAGKDWLSLQTTDDETRRIKTVAPLEGMTNLRSLVLQNNEVADLQPLTKMSKLKRLTLYRNKVSDPYPLANLQSLEELNLAYNPIESLAVLEQLHKLRWLSLSTDQVPCFAKCGCLSKIQVLEITGEALVDNVVNFPEMPALKVFRVYELKDTAGIERFPSLTTLELIGGRFSCLDGVEKLKGLTHLEAWSSQPLSLQLLSGSYGLRSVKILAPEVADLSALSRLPVLHEFRAGARDSEKITCNQAELEALRKLLTPWADEFKAPDKKAGPSFDIEVVNQETFDFYDSKEPFGIKLGECEDGMFKSEREWLLSELRGTLKVNFKEDFDADFLLPGTTGFRRSERLILYSLRAYERFREIVTAVQLVLCEARNDWIIYFQGLASEGADFEELPEGGQDFTIWVYPDKIMATEESAAVIRELMD